MNLLLTGGFTWFWETINSLFLTICSWIYVLISLLYQVFEAVAKINLFSEDAFNGFTQRIYVIIGIAMLFIFAYNLILMIINPNDKKTTGQMTKVVKETIISLVLVILLPTIFNYMYVFQNHVIESNIIGKIVLGGIQNGTCETDPTHHECNCDFEQYEAVKSYANIFKLGGNVVPLLNFIRWDYNVDLTDNLKSSCEYYKGLNDAQRGAHMIAPILIQAFYKPTQFTMEQCEAALKTNDFSVYPFSSDNEMKDVCTNYFVDINLAKYSGNIAVFMMDNKLLNVVSDSSKNLLEFNGLMALIAGVVAVIMFLSYTIDVGARVAKLGLLQIISPIAVMMRIIPKQKEKFYDKWFKNLLDTYLDVFIRLFIIYFVLYVVSLIPEVVNTIWSSFASGDDNLFIKALVLVFLILGLLRFAQEAPALFKEFFSNSGKFGLKSLDSVKAGVYGATTGQGLKGKVGGFFSGAARGAYGGYDKAVKGLDTARTERENGSTFGGRTLDRLRTGIGMETRGESDTRQINKLDEKIKNNDEIRKNYKQPKDIVSKAIENEKSKIKVMNGKTYTELKEQYDQMMLDASNMTDERARRVARERATQFWGNVKTQRENIEKAAITDLLQGGDYGGTLKKEDVNTIQKMLNDVEMLGGKRVSTEAELKAYVQSLEQEQADTIEKRNVIVSSPNSSGKSSYRARQADSRIVRGQGKSEKK